MKKIETTLLLLLKENQILLAMKKRGFGVGKYNGVGGKLECGETPEAAMLRETKEEIGVTPTEYQKVGVIDFFEYFKGEMENVVFHLYTATKWEGQPVESDEMKPEWFDIGKIPYDKMFEDDKYWLPYVLAGRKFDAVFNFDEDWKLLSHEFKFAN